MTVPDSDPLAGPSWRVAGRVCIDSATVVLGDPDAFLSWRASGARPPDDVVLDQTLAFLATGGDWDCPIEKGILGADVVAVRVEFYSDVANIAGWWDDVGELSLNTPRCVVVDPTWTIPAQAQSWPSQPPSKDADLLNDSGIVVGSIVNVPSGRYRVEVLNHPEQEPLGIRLRLV